MPAAKTLADIKRKVSDSLLNVPGVSGVGLRGDHIVVYLETDEAGSRQRIEQTAHKLAPDTPLILEVTGRFGKQ